jgi:hypothetical protein
MKTFVIEIYQLKKTIKKLSVIFERESEASIYASGIYSAYAEIKGATGFNFYEV